MDIVLCLLTLGLACPSNPGNANPGQVQQSRVQVQRASAQEVPEPSTVLSSLLVAGIGYGIKKVRKPE